MPRFHQFAQWLPNVSLILLPNQWQSGNARNWKTGDARFKSRSRLSTQPFGVFRGFLRNSRKSGLGSFRKTPTDCTPRIGPGLTNRQLAFNLQSTNQPLVSGRIIIDVLLKIIKNKNICTRQRFIFITIYSRRRTVIHFIYV